MPSIRLEPLLQKLAEEFKARRMETHLELLRAYYRDLRRRTRAAQLEKKPPWTEELVIGWLCNLQIPPFEYALPTLAHGARPCACDVKAAGFPAVACVFPGGSVRECALCGARWLQMEREGDVTRARSKSSR